MHATIYAAVSLVIALISSAVAAPPVEIYGNDPDTSDVRISPDGGKLAMAISVKGESVLLVTDLATGKNQFVNTT